MGYPVTEKEFDGIFKKEGTGWNIQQSRRD